MCRAETVHKPLYTGIKTIDTLISIGRGQRQLLISDEDLGRSALAIDTVLNTIDILRRYSALGYTAVVVAEASSLPGMQ